MTTFTSPVSAGSVVVLSDPLWLAMSAYLARFKGISREHSCSDLNVFVAWCAGRGVVPLAEAAATQALEWLAQIEQPAG